MGKGDNWPPPKPKPEGGAQAQPIPDSSDSDDPSLGAFFAPFKTGSDGRRYYELDGKRYDVPQFEPMAAPRGGSKETPPAPLSPAEIRQQNLENALEGSLIKMFQENKSALGSELVLREVVRTFLGKRKKSFEVGGKIGMFERKSPASDEEQASIIRQFLEDLLGSGTLTENGVIGGETEYRDFPGAKKGIKQIIKVPIPNSNKIGSIEFTPLVVIDKNDKNKFQVVKVFCDSVKISE